MKYIYGILLITLSMNSLSNEFKWENQIGSMRSYESSTIVCFETDKFTKKLCFDQKADGGDIKLSMLLAAKMSNTLVDVAFKTPNNDEMAAWYNHEQFYWAKHIYIR